MDTEREKMREENEFQQVIERYEEMVRKSRSSFFDVEEFEQIIDYYLDLRLFTQAHEASEFARSQHPNSPDILIKVIHIYIENGKPLPAMEFINKLPAWEDENPEVSLLKGTALSQLGRMREAEKHFDQALALSEDDKVEILLNISMTFESARQYGLAVKYLLKAWEYEPDNLAVLYDLGYFYERLHNYKQSLRFYDLYLDEDTFSDNVWFNLGIVLYKLKESRKAIEAYDYAIALNPSYASAYFNKANIYAEQDDYANAIRVYSEFLELEPEHVQAWCYLGECYEEMGDYLEALNIYKKVIEIDNTNPEGWFGSGISLMYLKRLDEAKAYILKAIEFDSHNPEFWFTLADIYESTECVDEAIKCYKQTTILDKGDHEAWIRWASLYFKQKKYESAQMVLREAYRHNFNIPRILFYIAATYFKLNDPVTGLTFIEKGLAIDERELKEFFLLYPEGRTDTRISNLLKNSL